MKKTYYLFNPGRLSRKDNTLKFVSVDKNGKEQDTKYIPIEGISDLYIFGSLDANSALYNFLAKNQIVVHFFDYYENYTGSFMPKEYLQAGKVLIEQTLSYTNPEKRIFIARNFVHGAAFNMLRNLKYYHNRNKELENEITEIEAFSEKINGLDTVSALMGIEGNIRITYYSAFDKILKNFVMEGRSKRPPKNEINALISFGNMICYTNCMNAIYHTQLNPTISYLHEPGTRRFSLALDLAEIFKPVMVDRTIFKIVNRGEIQKKDFSFELNMCLLKESGIKTFIKVYEEQLAQTIQHRELKKKVSYKHLVRLECYKLSKQVLGIQEYKPFKIWW